MGVSNPLCDHICDVYFALAMLCDVKTEGNFRPLCVMVGVAWLPCQQVFQNTHISLAIFVSHQLTSDPLWLPRDVGRAAQTQTLLGPFLSLSGLLQEWVGPTDKLHLLNSPEDELRALGETMQQKLGICRVREGGREGGKEGRREGGREGRREGVSEGGREGGRELD